MSIEPRQRTSSNALLMTVFALSVLAHVPLALLLLILTPDDTALTPAALQNAQDFAINLVEESQEPTVEPAPDAKPRRFVELPEPEREQSPKEADFVARYADSVERQTVRPTEPGAIQEASPTIERPPFSRALAPPQVVALPVPAPTPLPESEDQDAEPLKANDDALPSQDEPVEPVEGQETSAEADDLRRLDDSRAQIRPEQLFPKLSDPSFASHEGAGGFFDPTREIEHGDRTLLNRQRTRYWAFFERLTEQVRQHWVGGEVYNRHDPRGNVYGVRDRVTTLRITLRGDGQIDKIWISSPSGLDFLDEEAVRAVRAAAPFLNAPDGMKDRDGLIHFSFSFYIEIRADDANWLRINWRR